MFGAVFSSAEEDGNPPKGVLSARDPVSMLGVCSLVSGFQGRRLTVCFSGCLVGFNRVLIGFSYVIIRF